MLNHSTLMHSILIWNVVRHLREALLTRVECFLKKKKRIHCKLCKIKILTPIPKYNCFNDGFSLGRGSQKILSVILNSANLFKHFLSLGGMSCKIFFFKNIKKCYYQSSLMLMQSFKVFFLRELRYH